MITIRLLRKDAPLDPKKDVVIRIRHKGENVYHLFYTDTYAKYSEGHDHMTVLEGDQLDTYLLSLFNLAGRDRDPFDSIQFDIPCFPTVLFHPKDMKDEDIQQALLDVMPLLVSASCVSKVAKPR